jgi:hypothetical protein
MKNLSFTDNIHFCVVPLKEVTHPFQYHDGGQLREKEITSVAEYGVYLVNASEQDIEKVLMAAGDYVTVDDELVQSTPSHKDWQRLPKKQALLVETFESWVLDFVTWYNFELWLDDTHHVQLSTQRTKDYQLTEKHFHEALPVIGKKGYILPWFPQARQDATT